jgi:hypothetical protein
LCTFAGGVYENLSTDDWQIVKTLIVEDYKAHTEV